MSKATAKVQPHIEPILINEKYKNPLVNLEIGNAYINHCDFTDNKNHGIYLNKVYTTVTDSSFFGNLGHAIYVPSHDQKVLLKVKCDDS